MRLVLAVSLIFIADAIGLKIANDDDFTGMMIVGTFAYAIVFDIIAAIRGTV